MIIHWMAVWDIQVNMQVIELYRVWHTDSIQITNAPGGRAD